MSNEHAQTLYQVITIIIIPLIVPVFVRLFKKLGIDISGEDIGKLLMRIIDLIIKTEDETNLKGQSKKELVIRKIMEEFSPKDIKKLIKHFKSLDVAVESAFQACN